MNISDANARADDILILPGTAWPLSHLLLQRYRKSYIKKTWKQTSKRQQATIWDEHQQPEDRPHVAAILSMRASECKPRITK